MDAHPLHLISYTTWNFRSLSKNGFRVRRHDLYFCVVKTTCISHSFFSFLAKFWVRLPLYCRKIIGLSIDLVLLFWCSFGVVLIWSLPPLIIFSRVWFTIFEDHSSGYWFLVCYSSEQSIISTADQRTQPNYNCSIFSTKNQFRDNISGTYRSISMLSRQSTYDPGRPSIRDSTEQKKATGVAQGEKLSQLVFSLFIADLYFELKCKTQDFIFYADDLVLGSHCQCQLQQSLNNVNTYCSRNFLKINVNKTICIKLRRGARLAVDKKFYISKREVEFTNNFGYLGEIFSSTLSPSHHLQHLMNNAYQPEASINQKLHLQKVSFNSEQQRGWIY